MVDMVDTVDTVDMVDMEDTVVMEEKLPLDKILNNGYNTTTSQLPTHTDMVDTEVNKPMNSIFLK
jgi:hypothetical protein